MDKTNSKHYVSKHKENVMEIILIGILFMFGLYVGGILIGLVSTGIICLIAKIFQTYKDNN